MTRKPASDSVAATAAAESRREALLDAAARDSPVLTLIARRLRAAKKKAKRAEEIESIKAAGREINADQEEVLKAKARNLAAIEELERLFPLLKEAVTEELSQKLSAKAKEIEEIATAAAAEKAAEAAKATAEAHDVERTTAAALADELKAKIEEATQKAAAEEVRRAEEKSAEEARVSELQAAEQTSIEESIMRLLQLFYFSKLFSKEGRTENDYIHQLERDACLTYKSTVSFAGDSLTSQDLDAICLFGKLVSTRPSNEVVSHETALERCKALALDWVNAAETPIPQLQTTVNELVVKFERIVGSTYYSVKPEMRAPEGSADGLEGLPNGFIPASSAGYQPGLGAGYQPPASSGFLPSVTGSGQAPSKTAPNAQPPGFEPLAAQKASPTPDTAPSNYYSGSYQGPTFGGITSAELAARPPSSNPPTANGIGQSFSAPPESSLATSALPETVSPQAKQQVDDVDTLIDKIPERKGSSGSVSHPRPRAAPNEYSRGRGPGRGRGGPARGEYVPRGGRRPGPPPGRGYRGGGRGRDFQPHYNPQAVSSEMY